MPYICEDELIRIYQAIGRELDQIGLHNEIALIRDYMLKILISEGDARLGKLIIDYSPKRLSFSYRRDSDLSEEQFERIVKYLEGRVGPNTAANVKTPRESAKTAASAQKKADDIDYNGLPTQYQAFVDGSFIESATGYGAVILDRGRPVAELYGRVDGPDAFAARQVGGEIRAVVETIEWCKKNGVKGITIFYDFRNIEKWATGEFKTNTEMTQAYKRYIDECVIEIFWRKVESHTGIVFNDRADELAKAGARGAEPQQQDSGASG